MKAELYDKIIEVAEKLDDKSAPKAKEFLEKNRDKLEDFSEQTLKGFIGHLGMGQKEEAADLLKIASQSPQELIEGMAKSADEIRKAHDDLKRRAKEYNEMAKGLAVGAAKTLGSIMLTIL